MASIDSTKLTPTQLAALTPQQFASLTADQISKLTLDQVAAVKPAQLAAMTTVQAAALTYDELKTLTGPQLGALMPSTFKAALTGLPVSTIGSAVATIITGNATTPTVINRIGAIDANEFAYLTQLQLAAIPVTQIPLMVKEQLQALTAKQLSALTSYQTGALTVSEVGALLPAQLSALSPSQVAAIFSTDGAAKLATITPANFTNLTALQLKAIPAELFGRLQEAQVAALTPDADGNPVGSPAQGVHPPGNRAAEHETTDQLAADPACSAAVRCSCRQHREWAWPDHRTCAGHLASGTGRPVAARHQQAHHGDRQRPLAAAAPSFDAAPARLVDAPAADRPGRSGRCRLERQTTGRPCCPRS